MILPAILETDPKRQIRRMKLFAQCSKTLHTDIMDGKFVKKKNLDVLRNLVNYVSPVHLELHLMVQEPLRLFFDIRRVKPVKRIVLQIESDWMVAFEKYKKYYEVGIAFKPETPISYFYNLPLKIRGIKGVMKLETHNSPPPSLTLRKGEVRPSFILLLSVTPGAQGNPFQQTIYRRVREARKRFPKLRIEIDGALNPLRIRKLKKLGATDFVVGSYLKQENVQEKMKRLKKLASG